MRASAPNVPLQRKSLFDLETENQRGRVCQSLGTPMQTHKLTLACDGRQAALGWLDAADIPDVTMGAKRLLATSAHFYTEGRVPRNTETKTDYFRMDGGSPGGEPWAYDVLIKVLGSEVYDVAKYTFRDHLLSMLVAWKNGTSFHPPEFLRLQPLLHVSGNLNSAICESEPPLNAQLLRLSQRTSQAMDLVTRPLAKSASELRLMLDDAGLISFERRSREWEIAEYSRRLKAQETIAGRLS
jgi:hypothetical protein